MTRTKLLAILVVLVATVGLVVRAIPAAAQGLPQCGPWDAIVKRLTEQYTETQRFVGLVANNNLMEVYASDTGSWTITISTPQGITCLVASGTGFEAMQASPHGQPI